MNWKWTLIGIGMMISSCLYAQEDTTYYEGDDYYEDYEYPKNFFFRIALSDLLIDSSPAEMEFTFWDDDWNNRDSINGVINTDNLWSYGLNFGLSILLEPDWMINYDAHFGLGSGGKMMTFTNQLGLGKEFKFKSFYLQPMMTFGYIGSNINMGTYSSSNKGHFEVNGRFITPNITTRLKSRALTLNPALLVEYSLNRDLSVFGKVGLHYVYYDNNFITVGGSTDEINEDGDAVTAIERISFSSQDRLNFNINNQPILRNNSPYFNYNFNAVQVQIGLSYALSFGELADEMIE